MLFARRIFELLVIATELKKTYDLDSGSVRQNMDLISEWLLVWR